MTTEEALRVIYQTFGYTKEEINWRISNSHGLSNPTIDTPEGLAEFARLVLWAFSQDFFFTDFGDKYATLIHSTIEPYEWSKASDTPQEAFVLALADAIQARKGGGE